MRNRLTALARAHDLTLPHGTGALPQAAKPATLRSLIHAITAPHDAPLDDTASRFSVVGCDVPIAASVISNLALLLHEFVTNSTKYGALSATGGRIQVHCGDEGETVTIVWTERGGPKIGPPTSDTGFGAVLIRSTIGALKGELSRDWQPDGLVISVSIPRERLTGK